MYEHLLKIADTSSQRVAWYCELVDLLFSNGQNVSRAKPKVGGFVIIIEIYKVTSNDSFK